MEQIIHRFLSNKKNITEITLDKVNSEHENYLQKRNRLLQNLAKLYFLFTHLTYITDCDEIFLNEINASDEIKDIWFNITQISDEISREIKNNKSKVYYVYYSPKRNSKNQNLIYSFDKISNTFKLKIENCLDTFIYNSQKRITASESQSSKYIHVNPEITLICDKNLLHFEGDCIFVLYLDVFFYRTLNGKIYKKIYKGFNTIKLERLLKLCSGSQHNDKCNESLELLKELISINFKKIER